MRWRGRVLVTLLAVGVIAGGLYATRRHLILFYVGTLARRTTPVAPHREIVWQRGPEMAAVTPDRRPPNIVLILADDLGFNDISFHGGGLVATPNIDSIAREGAVFSRAYAGTAACAPSRAMIMTGRYGTRTGFEFTPTPPGMMRILDLFFNDGTRPHELLVDYAVADRLPPFAEQGLPGSEVTIAEALATRGYHRIHIGKWHIGNSVPYAPLAQGFDEAVMMESGLYLPEDDPRVVNAKLPFDPIDQFLWARMQYATSYNGGEWFEPRGYLTDFFTDEAVKAIEANRHRPFFINLAHWGVHTPLQALVDDYDALAGIDDHRTRVYAAMIRALDRSVGRVLQALADNGLADNTLVLFTSDNGGAGYVGLPEINRPFRGWKLTFFEGGIRVPLFARWPARVDAGTRIDAPVAHIDVFPTIAAAAGAALPSDRVIDGLDLTGLLGDPASPLLRDALFWRDGHYQAVLSEGWKLQVSARPDKAWLFDLTADPTEQVNLADRRPDMVARLQALLVAHNATQRPPLFPAAGEMPVMVDRTLEDVGTADDEYVYWPG
jgi:uncharacterized sulfatase